MMLDLISRVGRYRLPNGRRDRILPGQDKSGLVRTVASYFRDGVVHHPKGEVGCGAMLRSARGLLCRGMAVLTIEAFTRQICLNCHGEVLPKRMVRRSVTECECQAAPLIDRYDITATFRVLWRGPVWLFFDEWGEMPDGFTWGDPGIPAA